jgi:hypothetical protein
VADAESFTYPRPNLIVSARGFSVEVLLPSTIRYEEADRSMDVFAELLVSDEPRLAVRRHDVRAWQGAPQGPAVTEAERATIIENLESAFAFKGWTLVIR